MKRREFIALLGSAAAALPLAAAAQPKIPRIGFMGNSTAALEANLLDAFREGLRELGYEEGRNIVIEYRWANGEYDYFPALVAELIAAKVDAIVTAGTPAALAVKNAKRQMCRSSWWRSATRSARVLCRAWRDLEEISRD